MRRGRFDVVCCSPASPAFEPLERRTHLDATFDTSTFELSVSFQPGDASPPAAFVVDAGGAFGLQANGMNYGWDRDRTKQVRPVQIKTPPGASPPTVDPLFQSVVVAKQATWSVEVPNGNYVVTVGAGDGKASRRARVQAEDVAILDARATREERWLQGSGTVTVTDGKLDLTPIEKFRGNRLAFITVRSAAATPVVNLPTTIDWQTAATGVRQPRVEAAVATIGSRLYVMGGFVSGYDVGATSDVFDAATGSWRAGPTLRGAQTHAGVTSDNARYIYKAGGQLGGGIPGTPTADVWRLDTRTNAWTSLPALPQARYAPGMALIGQTLHVFGGTLPDRTTVTTDHWTLNLAAPKTGWQVAPAMPEPGDHSSVVVLGGQIYVIGGEHGHATTEQDDAPYVQHNTLFRYDPATSTWTTLAAMPVGRSHAEGTTLALDGKILFMGGKLNPTDVSNRADLYDPITNSWTSLGDLPVAMQGGAAVYYGGKIFLSHGQVGAPSFDMHQSTWVGTPA